MGILTGFLTGAGEFIVFVHILYKIANMKLDRYNIHVDPIDRKLYIKCRTEKIPCDNFKVYIRVDKKKTFLYIKGASVTGDDEIVTVEHEYLLRGIQQGDLQKMTWSVSTDGKLIVEIPLSSIDKHIAVKRLY